jgi:hypothetical protein
MNKSLKNCIIVFAVLVCLNVVMSLSGIAIGILNYVDFHLYYIKQDESKVFNDIWILPDISGETKALSFFPFFGYRYIGSPFKVGLRAVDYGNKNQCEKLEIIELSLNDGVKTLQIVDLKSTPVIAKFKKYLPDSENVAAQWYANVIEGLNHDTNEEIILKARYRIYKKNGIIEDDIKIIYKSQHYTRTVTFEKLGMMNE